MRPLHPGEPPAIGPYRLVGVIGSGGMGRVFLGIAPDGRLAAVKQVLAAMADDPGFRSRFAREVDASRRVSGAHTAPVLDADLLREAKSYELSDAQLAALRPELAGEDGVRSLRWSLGIHPVYKTVDTCAGDSLHILQENLSYKRKK